MGRYRESSFISLLWLVISWKYSETHFTEMSQIIAAGELKQSVCGAAMQLYSFQNRCGSKQEWRFACSGAQPRFTSPCGCSCQAGSGACHFGDTRGAEKWHGHICSVLPLVFTGSSDGENVRIKVATESKLLTELYRTDTRELSVLRGWMLGWS